MFVSTTQAVYLLRLTAQKVKNNGLLSSLGVVENETEVPESSSGTEVITPSTCFSESVELQFKTAVLS